MSEIKMMVTQQLQQLQMLMHRASFHGMVGDRKMFQAHRGQGRVLAVLKLKPEISQRDLTYLLGMSKQSLAELLTKLEKSGYIAREPSQEDKRIVLVRLTEEGAKVATDDMDDGATEASQMLDCLNEEELDAFSGYLARIIQQYEEQFPQENFEERRRMMGEFMAQHAPHGFGGGFGGPMSYADEREEGDEGFFGGRGHHEGWGRR